MVNGLLIQAKNYLYSRLISICALCTVLPSRKLSHWGHHPSTDLFWPWGVAFHHSILDLTHNIHPPRGLRTFQFHPVSTRFSLLRVFQNRQFSNAFQIPRIFDLASSKAHNRLHHPQLPLPTASPPVLLPPSCSFASNVPARRGAPLAPPQRSSEPSGGRQVRQGPALTPQRWERWRLGGRPGGSGPGGAPAACPEGDGRGISWCQNVPKWSFRVKKNEGSYRIIDSKSQR